MNQTTNKDNRQGLDAIAGILIRCFILSAILLLAWFVWFLTWGYFGYQFHSNWFGLTLHEFNLANFYGMVVFKVLMVILFLIPFMGIKAMLNCKCAEKKLQKKNNLPGIKEGLCCSGR